MIIVQIKEQFEEDGYTSYDSTVDVPVTADDNNIAVIVRAQDISVDWKIEV